MNLSKRRFMAIILECATLSAGLVLLMPATIAAQQPGASKTAVPESVGQPGQGSGDVAPACLPAKLGSPYIPVDSWVYPAVLRLYSLGFVDDVFLGMRPWTRASVSHMVEQAGARFEDASAGPATDEAQGIYDALMHELAYDTQGPCLPHQGKSRIESVYSVARGDRKSVV
jgi:hypothetical protein